ncbi:hypothetical protein PZB74_09970 [Porifericola rhodea]|uniref:DUF6992 family protein n=1 Tax=Porifericola rhodea TaxID=930972 RepID=UPI002665D8E7|nr:hypothetical protein [Porifericola rhodea]WKN33650.1 hypothetical protein PZB74_09970 [Porifericola rhodea]
MKKCVLLLFFFIFLTQAYGQNNNELLQFNETRLKISKIGMLSLGAWAIANIATNGVLMSRTEGRQYYFHQMNTYWNIVNLAIAGFGYYNSIQSSTDGLTLSSSVSEFYGLQKMLLFNAGLDVAYVAGGLLLLEKAKSSAKRQNRFRGYGQGLILQGAFLLAFDSVMYFLMDSHASELLPLLQVSTEGIGLRIQF